MDELERKLRRRFSALKNEVKTRVDKLGNPIKVLLTREEFIKKWMDAHEMGIRKGQYCMSRVDANGVEDVGHYEIDNVKIRLTSKNVSVAQVEQKHSPESLKQQGETFKKNYVKENHRRFNNPLSDKEKKHLSDKKKGIPRTEEQKANIKKAMAQRRLIEVDGKKKYILKTDPLPPNAKTFK
jgi:hypothetical protein